MPDVGFGIVMLVVASFFLMTMFGGADTPAAPAPRAASLAQLAEAPCAQEQVEKFVYGGFGVPEIVQYCPEKANDPGALAMSAQNGHWAAAMKLGAMYGEGLTVRRDPVEAFAWYRFAADLRPQDSEIREAVTRAQSAVDDGGAWRADRRVAEIRDTALSEAGIAQAAPQRSMPSVVVVPPIFGSPGWGMVGPNSRSIYNSRRYRTIPRGFLGPTRIYRQPGLLRRR